MAWTKQTLPGAMKASGIFGGDGRWMVVDVGTGNLMMTNDFTSFTTTLAATVGPDVHFPNSAVHDGVRWYLTDEPNWGGLYRSTDGLVGATWERVTTNFRGGASIGWPGDVGSKLIMLASGRLVVVMCTATDTYGLSTSDDGGATWTLRYTSAVAFSYSVASALPMVDAGGKIYAAFSGAFVVSSDDGATWATIPTSGAVEGFAVLPDDTLVANEAGQSFLRTSTNLGTSWTATAVASSAHSFYGTTTAAAGYMFRRPNFGETPEVFYNEGSGWLSYSMTGVSTDVSNVERNTAFIADDAIIAFGADNATEMGLWTEAAIVPPVLPDGTETIDDAADASDVVTPGGGPTLVETASATEEATGLGGPMLEDAADADDELFSINARIETESADASDEVFSSASTSDLIEDTALASEQATAMFSASFEETATADESVFVDAGLAVEQAADASEELTLEATVSMLVEDGAEAGDDAIAASAASLEEIAQATDEHAVTTGAMLTEQADASDEIDEAGETDDLLADSAAASDETFTVVSTGATIVDAAEAYDLPIFARTGLIAWLMNTETGAPSWYSNWPFTGMATVGNKVLAVGPAGLAVLGGDLDDGAPIAAKLKYGYSEFGGYNRANEPKPDENKKRIESFYVGYSSSGVLDFTIKVQGYAEYRYTMEQRTATDPRNNRVKPGKGLVGRYWQIGIENTAGAAFDVSSLSADVATSNRRI